MSVYPGIRPWQPPPADMFEHQRELREAAAARRAAEPRGRALSGEEMTALVHAACRKALDRIAAEKLKTQADDPEGLAERRWSQR